MDYTLIGLKNTYCFLDDILIVNKESEADHKQYVLECLKRLDDDNLKINLPNCHFSKLEIDWLGFLISGISQSGILPIESKISAILSPGAPKTLKKLRSFLCSVHYISKFIPNSAQISHPLQPLLRKSSKFIWNEVHKIFFLLK